MPARCIVSERRQGLIRPKINYREVFSHDGCNLERVCTNALPWAVGPADNFMDGECKLKLEGRPCSLTCSLHVKDHRISYQSVSVGSAGCWPAPCKAWDNRPLVA